MLTNSLSRPHVKLSFFGVGSLMIGSVSFAGRTYERTGHVVLVG